MKNRKHSLDLSNNEVKINNVNINKFMYLVDKITIFKSKRLKLTFTQLSRMTNDYSHATCRIMFFTESFESPQFLTRHKVANIDNYQSSIQGDEYDNEYQDDHHNVTPTTDINLNNFSLT